MSTLSVEQAVTAATLALSFHQQQPGRHRTAGWTCQCGTWLPGVDAADQTLNAHQIQVMLDAGSPAPVEEPASSQHADLPAADAADQAIALLTKYITGGNPSFQFVFDAMSALSRAVFDRHTPDVLHHAVSTALTELGRLDDQDQMTGQVNRALNVLIAAVAVLRLPAR